MKTNTFRGDLTDNSAKKEALLREKVGNCLVQLKNKWRYKNAGIRLCQLVMVQRIVAIRYTSTQKRDLFRAVLHNEWQHD